MHNCIGQRSRAIARPAGVGLAIVAALSLLAACGADDTAPDPATLAMLEGLDAARSTTDVGAAVMEAAAQGDARFVPYLVDLLRVEVDPARIEQVTSALSELTGLTPAGDRVDNHVTFGSWLLDRNGIEPPESYPAWKARLYRELDPDFEALITPLRPRLAAEIQWGGVGFDGIDAIDTPPLVSPVGAGYLDDGDIVFGAVIDGTARAYPRRILDVHELSNDVLAGEPVVLANCTLCRSALLFSRTVAGRQLEFVTSGLLLDSNKIMVDRETGSLWQQLTGTAIAGPLEGLRLEPILLTTTTWSEWLRLHPATLVIDLPEQRGPELAIGAVSYDEGDAYRAYYRSDELWFPTSSTPGGPPKVEVIGIVHNGQSMGIELEPLIEAAPLEVTVGGADLTVVPTAGDGARVYLGAIAEADISSLDEEALHLSDGRTLPRIESTSAFWFAWSATHPDSSRWP